MVLRTLPLLATLFTLACADVKFTSPAPGDTISGTTISIEWTDSGTDPPLSDLTTYQMFLCTGGNDANSITVLAPLTTAGLYSDGNTFSGTFEATLGGTTENAYFLKMISAATGGVVINYSSRFSLSDMTGTFPAAVETALSSVSGTAGPPTQNQIAAANTPADAGAATPDAAEYTVAYTMQTGATRFAPMPTRPGTKITNKNPTPQFPTSAYTPWQSVSGPPNAVFTLTLPETDTYSSMEPTIAAAPMPSDNDMQKFLKRWQD